MGAGRFHPNSGWRDHSHRNDPRHQSWIEHPEIFPAETMGGLKAIKAMSDPFPQLRFIPTGGVKLENAAEYLQMEKIHAIGGSWMAKRPMIADQKFDEITRMAKEASDIVKQNRRAS